MDESRQKSIVEALILGTPEPISAQRIAGLLPRGKPAAVKRLVETLNAEYAAEHRAFEIWEVAGGYQLRTLAEFAPYLQQIQPTRPMRLSKAALETLAIVAYRQPATRAEVEHVRGVDAGAVLRSLLERKLVRIAGHREVPGRPMLYGTTRRFLEVFGLDRLEDLPTLRDIEEIAPELGLDLPEAAPAAEALDQTAIDFDDAEPVGKPH
jgi:segregation and condensation protein B